ncbi:putative reverse transcriptase domain-containing protein [Tanacetum coccineum]
MDGLDAMLKNGIWFIRNKPLILKKWHPDVNLLKEDVSNVLVWVKLHGVSVTVSQAMLENLIKLQADVELKDTIVVFGHTQEECPENIGFGEVKNLKKPSQTPRGVPFGLKVGFKPVKQVFRHDSKKLTANTSKNKKKNMEPTKEGKPLEKVDSSRDYDSEDKVSSVDNEIASFLAKKDGYGTNSLLEQWKNPYENADYDYDPYDDDMYEGQEVPKKSSKFVFLSPRKLFANLTGGDVGFTLILYT